MPEVLEAVELGGNRSTSLARSLTARSGYTLQQCAALLLHSDSPYRRCVPHRPGVRFELCSKAALCSAAHCGSANTWCEHSIPLRCSRTPSFWSVLQQCIAVLLLVWCCSELARSSYLLVSLM